jgi:tetratricopeptide (TPR) repeat protein
MSEQPPVRRIMISSTALDLPEHRKQARDACERMSMLPLVMEQMPASSADALALSRAYVDQADFYLGIFAFRYGFVPDGEDKSITELEYDRAVERGIPTLVFIAHEKHPVPFDDVDTGEGAPKLRALKERLRKDHVVRTFRSPEELRTEIIHALSVYRQDDTAKLHYVAEIPPPPAPWVAHWYSLLGTRSLIGRRDELNLLTDWVARPSSALYNARLLALVAIGGMGKSALAWTWWNEIAPNEMKPLAGRMWWSFYESDARLENFTARALAYLTGRPRVVTEKIPVRDREDQLLAILDREPHLVVLDGLERELVAYSRMDAAHLSDDDLDARTAHSITRLAGLPETAAQSFVGEAKLRQTTDPRTGQFLRRLAQVRAARILVTTRLFPVELQAFHGGPLPGTFMLFMPGLRDDDAVALWRSAGISGARDVLIPLFNSFEGHPLLVQALAGEISRDRRSPGDFDKWKEHHPDFNPFALPLVQRKSHVLAYALQGLATEELALLRAIAGFRMPAVYETLAALLVGEDQATQPFSAEDAFDRALADLDDRGLVGWDRRANRYDLHPIVRGVVWTGAAEGDRQAIAERMRAHFEPMPALEWDNVERLDDLTPAIELYVSLIRLGLFDEALEVFRDRLEDATLYRLSASRQRVELLEMLFTDGVEQPPRLREPRDQGFALNAIALGLDGSGQPGRALPCYRRACAIDEGQGDRRSLTTDLENLSLALHETGALHAAEASAARALGLARAEQDEFWETWSLNVVGLSRAVRGLTHGSSAFSRSLRILRERFQKQAEGYVRALLAQTALWYEDAAGAQPLADSAWAMAGARRDERDFIRAARLQGQVAVSLGDLERADERLHHALTRARAVNLVEHELPALTALAVLCDRRGETVRAREHLDSVWDAAERGPYRLRHADARNVLAEIEIRSGRIPAAIAAATAAYRLAWCDGPPFAYDYGLRTARAHLRTLGAPEPEMPPYDASKHEPIEDIPINPEGPIGPEAEDAR